MSQQKTNQITEARLIESRVRKSLRELSAYSAPRLDCAVRLDGNESPFALSKGLETMVQNAIRKVEVNRYPDPEAKNLRNIISKVSGFSKDRILLGNGSDELIGMLITTFSGGTKKILYPTPTFSMYGLTGLAMGMELIELPLDEQFDIDSAVTIEAINKNNPDLIFLASPNNPTGNAFSSSKIREILDCSEGVVVIDEAYSDFSGHTFMPLLEEYDNLVILRTLSKVGFAGLRLGILYAREGLVREINKVRYPYNVNSLSQEVAEVILNDLEFVNENVQLILKERHRVYDRLSEIGGLDVYRSDANFIFFRVKGAGVIFNKLIKKGVLIRNFHSLGRLKNCLRVTIGAPHENEAFLIALRDVLSS